MERITVLGFLARLAVATVLVCLTYNPTGHSYLHWLSTTLPRVAPLQAVAGLVLLGGWAFFAHATWRSLGTFGVVLAMGIYAATVWLLVSWGWIRLGDRALYGWLAVALLALLLAVGVSWSLVSRRVTGQVDVEEGHGR